jgi:hypothetical protein
MEFFFLTLRPIPSRTTHNPLYFLSFYEIEFTGAGFAMYTLKKPPRDRSELKDRTPSGIFRSAIRYPQRTAQMKKVGPWRDARAVRQSASCSWR